MAYPSTPIMMLRVGVDEPFVLRLKKPISPGYANLLHILAEFPNRIVPRAEICARLNTTDMAIRLRVSRVRKCLTSDWTIQSLKSGYRLIDLRDK